MPEADSCRSVIDSYTATATAPIASLILTSAWRPFVRRPPGTHCEQQRAASLREQMENLGNVPGRSAPLKMYHQAAKKRAEPHTKIVEELPHMRREAVQLVRQAVARLCQVLTEPRKPSPLTVHGLI